ncbi:hypothetical protein BH10PSE14_BH10PSE14_43040 [soil metagenome]
MTSSSDIDQTPLLSAKDGDLSGILPEPFLERFAVLSYRNAARILSSAAKAELAELIESLMAFAISTPEMVAGGGNKSKIAMKMDALLNPKGWYETRIRADMLLEKMVTKPNPLFGSKGERKTLSSSERFKILNVIDGHKIDFVKNRVAFDMEWNSKDQTFDRDLYAMRAFYDAGIIDAGVLLTRDVSLGPVFKEIGDRVTIGDFKSKYGASTTWMGKLTYRLDAGRNGGCPVLAIGITPNVVSDFELWKASNPVIREIADLGNLSEPAEEVEEA